MEDDCLLPPGEFFNILDVYPVGSDLFTPPNVLGVGRKFCGPTKWLVVVVMVGPRPSGIGYVPMTHSFFVRRFKALVARVDSIGPTTRATVFCTGGGCLCP